MLAKRGLEIAGLFQALRRINQRPTAIGLGRLDGCQASRLHQPCSHEPFDAHLVRAAPCAGGLAPRAKELEFLLIDLVGFAVHPAKAQTFFNQFVVADGGLIASLFVANNPDCMRAIMFF
jgi:hypothetical protein